MMATNPIQRFLGLPVETDSPFDLLGLTPARCGEQDVRSALVRRLGRVRRHPESLTHEADEVRLALYAAAAQLLDPNVRAQLIEEEIAANSLRSDSRHESADHRAFRVVAMHVLARAGGWNRKSMKWLGMLSRAHGLRESGLQAELRQLTAARTLRAVMPGSAATTPATCVTGPESGKSSFSLAAADSHSGRRGAGSRFALAPLWWSGVAALAAVLTGVLILAELRPARPSEHRADELTVQSPAPPLTTFDRRLQSAPDTRARIQTAPIPHVTPESIVRLLELAHAELDKDIGESAWRFERAVQSLSASWAGIEMAQRDHADELVAEYLHRVDADSPGGRRALEAVEAGVKTLLDPAANVDASTTFAAIWSGGTLARFASDTDADRAARDIALQTWSKLSGGVKPTARTSRTALEESLPYIAGALVARMRHHHPVKRGAWSAWSDSLDRLPTTDAAADRFNAERLSLQAAEFLLRADLLVVSDPFARDALTMLFARVQWVTSGDETSPPARTMLLSWFDEPGIASGALAVATEWIVAHSGATGMNPLMILTRGSIPENRVAIRERYARLWGLGVASDSLGFSAIWARAAREATDAFKGDSIATRLGRTAILARLNVASALRWRGEVNTASASLVDPVSRINSIFRAKQGPSGSIRRADPMHDGEWTIRYLGLKDRDVEPRAAMLMELGRHFGELGPVDAGTLADVALRSPINDLLRRAQEVVRRKASEPGVVISLLDAIALSPRNNETTALVSDVTGRPVVEPNDGRWPVEIRLALIERLLDMMAPNDDITVLDRLGDEILHAYAQRAEMRPAPSSDSFGAEYESPQTESAAVADADSVRTLWRSWRDQARRLSPNPRLPYTLDEILHRREGRLRLSRGPMQEFAAEQTNIVEAMAFVVSAERPSQADSIKRLLRSLSSHRIHAKTIVDQILAGERAILVLWGIRFDVRAEALKPLWGDLAEIEAPAPYDASGRLDLNSLDSAWISQSPIRDLRARLDALTPDDPQGVFDLAEELAVESDTPHGRALARRLFSLAYEFDRSQPRPIGLGPSVSLALASISPREDERRWLLALAISLDPGLASIVPLPQTTAQDLAVRIRLAEALELYRLGEYSLAQDRLNDSSVDALLSMHGRMLTGGAGPVRDELATEPVCRECHNRRIVPRANDPAHDFGICSTCGGDPGPDLSDTMLIEHLRLEQTILSDAPRSWSANLLATRGEPLRDMDPGAIPDSGAP